MKAIKIISENAEAIEKALAEVNGKSTAHTFTAAIDILHISDRAEGRLDALGIPKAERKGARFIQESGERLPARYQYKARTTRVVIERRASAWWLATVIPDEIYPTAKPYQQLVLTAAQDAKAIEVLRRGYTVIKSSEG